jgi:hypothetical protein
MATPRSRRAAVEAPHATPTAAAAKSEPALRDWLAELTGADDARAAAFDTRLDKPEWLTGAASHGIAKRLRHHGYTVVDTSSFLVTGNEGPLLDGELERARLWGTELAAALPVPQPGVGADGMAARTTRTRCGADLRQATDVGPSTPT